jgi:hypothetical protein
MLSAIGRKAFSVSAYPGIDSADRSQRVSCQQGLPLSRQQEIHEAGDWRPRGRLRVSAAPIAVSPRGPRS